MTITQNQNILVTGGRGLVGSAIHKISNDYDKYNFWFINSTHCDLTNYESTLNYFKNIDLNMLYILLQM